MPHTGKFTAYRSRWNYLHTKIKLIVIKDDLDWIQETLRLLNQNYYTSGGDNYYY